MTKEPRQTWDVDLLKQHVSELSQQVSELKQEVRRLETEVRVAKGAREKAHREVSVLRRVVQDNHLRYGRVNTQDQAASDDTASPTDGEGAATTATRPMLGQRAEGLTGTERVSPSIIDRIPTGDDGRTDMPTAAEELPALEVHPGWGNFVHKGEAGVIVGVSLLGLDSAGRDRVIERIGRQQQRHKELLPVFITDDDDFESLRREHYVFEYLPPWPGPTWEPDRERWEAFLLDRLVDIRGKFGIQLFVSFAPQGEPDDDARGGFRAIEAYLSKILTGDNA